MVEVTRRRLAALAAGLGAAPTGLARAAEARRPGPVAEGCHRFELGAFEVTMLLDAAAMIDGPWPIVGQDRPEAEVAALMRENRLPERRFRPGFTPVLVDTGRERILFDAGNGDAGFVKRPAGGRLVAALAAAGYGPDMVDRVVLTHGHTDHVGGLMEGDRPVFPHASYVIGAAEYAFWTDEARLRAAPEAYERISAAVFRTHAVPLADRTRFVGPGAEIAPGIHALAAFGHTPGHLAYHVESGGRRMLVWGDCAHHEVASLAHPEWHALFDMDKAEGAATRRRLYEMAAREEVVVAGYHTSFPSLGYLVRAGLGYRWIPVTYQFAE